MQVTSLQEMAINKLQNYKVGALFMEMGTGKTFAAYNLVRCVKVDFILFLTPCQNKQNLAGEISKYGGFDCEFEVLGIESLSNSDRIYLEIRKKMENKTCFVVCDESIKIKNYDAKRTKRIIELGKLAEYKLILNGTPLTRNLLDIWAQMEFLSPKILKMDLVQFKHTFCEFVTITKKIGNRKNVQEFITKYHNVEYLYSLICHYVYEANLELMTKQDYISLNYYLTQSETEKYNEIKKHYLNDEKMQELNNNVFLHLTQSLQHSYCLAENKLSVLEKLIYKLDSAKIIIFCKYKKSAEYLKEKYTNIEVLTYGKHSFGLNKQDKNIIIYFDKTFDYAQRIQSEFRIFRTGQKDNCTYYDITSNSKLDKMINENIENKISMAQMFKKISTKKEIEEII